MLRDEMSEMNESGIERTHLRWRTGPSTICTRRASAEQSSDRIICLPSFDFGSAKLTAVHLACSLISLKTVSLSSAKDRCLFSPTHRSGRLAEDPEVQRASSAVNNPLKGSDGALCRAVWDLHLPHFESRSAFVVDLCDCYSPSLQRVRGQRRR